MSASFYAQLVISMYLTRGARVDLHAAGFARLGPNANRVGARLTIWRIALGVEIATVGDVLTNQIALGFDFLEGNRD